MVTAVRNANFQARGSCHEPPARYDSGMHRDLPRLEKKDLLARLAAGHAAAVTVVTPNRRLAQSLRAQFDGTRVEAGLHAWESPDILPMGSLVERMWEDALFS